MTVLAPSDTRQLRHWLHGAGATHLVICCVEHPDPEAWSRAVLVPGSAHAVVELSTCVASLNPAVLLELVAGGAGGITVVLDGCADPGGAEAVVGRTSRFLSALGRRESVDGGSALPPERKRGPSWPIVSEGRAPVSRRVLLGRPDGLELAKPSDHATERLVEALRELSDGRGSGPELDAIPTGVPRFTASRCAGSGACARTCPVDALALTRTVLAEANQDRNAIAQFELTFDPARCTDCGQCVQVCPESALERSGEQLWSSLLADPHVRLRAGLIRRCGRCGAGHSRSGDLCAVCSYRSSDPFGSTMPPGWAPRPDPEGPGPSHIA
jgi:ferredoxin